MDINSVLYYSVCADYDKEAPALEQQTYPTLTLYYWCWAEYQNKYHGGDYTPYNKETGTEKIIKELKDYCSPQRLQDYITIWQDLDKVSFRYAIFKKNNVIIGEPSNNVQKVGLNANVTISYHVNGRHCVHRLLLNKN